MSADINQHNLIEQIRSHFPELEDSCQEELKKWEGEDGMPSNYIVVSTVLIPRLIQDISERRATDFLRRCADFLEKVCSGGDDEAINVIWVRIFEWLIFRPNELNFIWPILGPKTKANIRDAASRWSEAGRMMGKTENLPERNIPKDSTDFLV